MSHVTQSQNAALISFLTNDNVAVPGLGIADVTVKYIKDGQSSFTVKSLADTAGSVTSGNSGTFPLVDGQTLLVSVDGGGDQVVTFNTADFTDINNATAAEMAVVVLADVIGVSSADSGGGALVITSLTTGNASSIQINGGTANSAVGFPTTLFPGYVIWTDVGEGAYTILFFASELNTLGAFGFVITGTTIDQYSQTATVVAASVVAVPVTAQLCTLTGHLVDLKGAPLANSGISARVLGLPSVEQSQFLVGDDLVSTKTDANGEFFLSLVRLADVEIFIPAVNYRRRLVVPNQATAELLGIA